MAKKIVSLLVTLVFVLSICTAAFADASASPAEIAPVIEQVGSDTASLDQATVTPAQDDVISPADATVPDQPGQKYSTAEKQQRQQIRSKIKAAVQTIKQNHARNEKLRERIRSLYQEIKNQIKTIRDTGKNKGISQQDLTGIKAQLKALKADREALKATHAQGLQIRTQLKTAVKNKDLQGVQNCVSRIALLQDRRAYIYNKIITELQTILDGLQAAPASAQ